MSKDVNNRIDEMLADWRAPFPPKEESWERLSNRIEATSQSKTRRMWPMMVGAVAGFALTMGIFSLFSSDLTVIETAVAQHEQFTLPDGSVVSLNADSRLSYNTDSFLEDRHLELDGEAFFEVQKGSRFEVITDQGIVAVLGTSFNVLDRDALLEVTCVTGKVSVSSDDTSILLTPGLACDNTSGTLSSPFMLEGSGAWRTGSYSYVEDNLAFVMEEVERQFGVTLQSPDLSEMLYTGDFESKDLETTLTVICEPMGLDFSISGQTVTLTLK